MGVTLAAGVSLYPLMRYAVDTYAADFDKAKAVIEGDTVSKQRFYENLNYSDGKWKLTLKNGKVVDAGEITDFRVKDRKQHQVLRNVKLKTTVDTVRVRYAKTAKSNILRQLFTEWGRGTVWAICLLSACTAGIS